MLIERNKKANNNNKVLHTISNDFSILVLNQDFELSENLTLSLLSHFFKCSNRVYGCAKEVQNWNKICLRFRFALK